MPMIFGIPATMKLLFTLALLVQIARAAVKGKTRDILLIRVFRISVVTIQSGICREIRYGFNQNRGFTNRKIGKSRLREFFENLIVFLELLIFFEIFENWIFFPQFFGRF